MAQWGQDLRRIEEEYPRQWRLTMYGLVDAYLVQREQESLTMQGGKRPTILRSDDFTVITSEEMEEPDG